MDGIFESSVVIEFFTNSADDGELEDLLFPLIFGLGKNWLLGGLSMLRGIYPWSKDAE